MKYRVRSFFFLVFSFFLLEVSASSVRKDVEKLRKEFINQALGSKQEDTERIQSLLKTISPEGKWPGINYEDVSRTGFRHTRHLNNMISLARAYKLNGSEFKGNREVRKAFDSALAFWIKNDFICDNWWHNEIGTPSSFISMLLIMDKSLTKTQIDAMLPIARRANLNAKGARPSGDRIKIAGLQAKTALFCRDENELKDVLKVIESEIKYSKDTERGIQVDFSFHHRTDRVNNTLSYGLSYVNAYAEWAVNVYGTVFQFSDKSARLAVDYYLDGICKQMVYGRTEDTGIKNRDITRPQRAGNFSVTTPLSLVKITDYRHDELDNIIKARKNEPFTPQSFAKFFWQTEHFVFQRPQYYTSVRMFSTRNRNMEEPYNGEGLKNHFRADGTNYLSITGDEYLNLSPVNDWMRIPGATSVIMDNMPSEKEIQKEGLMDFVGAVTDGMYGAVAFDFISPHNPLKAKKSWFFFDDKYVCLGADIASATKYPVVTTLNQCHLKGRVLAGSNSKQEMLDKGNYSGSDFKWIWHNGVLYAFPEQQKISVSNTEASGSWYSVNRQTSSSKTIQKEDVFKLWIEHGVRPRSSSYSYIVYPSIDNKDIQKCLSKSDVRILANSKALQAVENTEANLVYAVFYKAGRLIFGNDSGELQMDSPGMVMLKLDKNKKLKSVTVSDPSRKLSKMHFNIKGMVKFVNDEVSSVSDVYNSSEDRTFVSVKLPEGLYAGKSINIVVK